VHYIILSKHPGYNDNAEEARNIVDRSEGQRMNSNHKKRLNELMLNVVLNLRLGYADPNYRIGGKIDGNQHGSIQCNNI